MTGTVYLWFTVIYIVCVFLNNESAYGFIAPPTKLSNCVQKQVQVRFCSSSSSPSQSLEPESVSSESSIQWELLNKHHVKGSWKGIWTTYDYIGDVIDETVASVNLNPRKGDGGKEDIVEHTHTIVIGATKSDCKTCFDSFEQKTLPVSSYARENLLQKCRLAGVSMINGPRLLRSGSMATELILKHQDGRLRVIYQYAPVWGKNVEPQSCPPTGLKLFRTTVSREAVRSTAPTAETEASDVPENGNPIFYRPVPPFNWHKKWAGTAWTYGSKSGDRGWAIDELDEIDSWHGITPVDCWNLRLPGGIHLQTPRIITGDTVGICRLAWLPTDETLLRVEAGLTALQPQLINDDEMIGFHPPSLTSMRCDMLKRVGELENSPRPSKEWNIENDEIKRSEEKIISSEISDNGSVTKAISESEDESFFPSASAPTPRDHLSL